MGILLIVGAVWAAGVLFAVALGAAAAGADEHSERVAARVGLAPERLPSAKPATRGATTTVVARWWEPTRSYPVTL